MTVLTFDRDTLPERPAIDSGVLFRFLREIEDAHTDVCEAIIRALLTQKRTIVLPTPVIAEYSRKSPTLPPVVEQFLPVPFDEDAALELGRAMPNARITALAKGLAVPGAYIKYDAMIVACAIVNGCDVILTLNDDLRKIADGTKINAARPYDFVTTNLPVGAPLKLFAQQSSGAAITGSEE